MTPAMIVVLGLVAAAMILSAVYFRRYAMTRPPLGVFDLTDIAIMLASIVIVPFLYLALPHWLVVGLLVVAVVSTLYFLLEPVLRAPWLIWLIVITLTVTDIVLAYSFGVMSVPSMVVNNLVLVSMVIGVTNLWAQSGMKARDVVVLGGALIVYDFVATSVVGQMEEMIMRLAELPFVPMFAWTVGSDWQWIGIGLGDTLLASVFPLVMRKAFGRTAGVVALVLGFVALGVTMLVLFVIDFRAAFPLMVVLGPLMLAQYAYWRRRCGAERTTWQYLEAEQRAAPAIRTA
jgi:hypothetical protein